MKTLYISYDGMTDPLGQSQVIPYLAGLSKLGHEISLISCEKKASDSDEYKFISQLLKDNGIQWFPLKYTANPPVVSTVMDVMHINKLAEKVVLEHQIEAIHCRSYIAALAGLKMKMKHGTKFIFDMRGFWADERVDGKLWSLKNPLYRLIFNYFKRKEKQFLTHADYIISLTESAKDIILTWDIPNQPRPIQVIPCCADMELFNSERNVNEEKKVWEEKLHISKDDFVISYLGSVGTWYMLEEMLDFFNVLVKNRPQAKFLFITPDQPDDILKVARGKGIPDEKVVIQKASRKEVPVLLSLCKVSLFFIKPVFSKKASSPTKMGEIMGLGIPVICNSNVGDTDRIIHDSGAGLMVNTFTDEEYQTIVDKIENLLLLNPHEIRRSALKHFSLEEGVRKYNEVYGKCKIL